MTEMPEIPTREPPEPIVKIPTPDLEALEREHPDPVDLLAVISDRAILAAAPLAIPGVEKAVRVREAVKAAVFGTDGLGKARDWLDEKIEGNWWSERVSDMLIRFGTERGIDWILDLIIKVGYRVLKSRGLV